MDRTSPTSALLQLTLASAVVAIGGCSDVRDEEEGLGGTGSAATQPPSNSTDDADEPGDSSGSQLLDIGDSAGGDGGLDPDADLDCGCDDFDFSYVWVANTAESTVSKINTRTLVEEGRYITRPGGAGSPSRTSVSVDGRKAVIANRRTGVTAIWALPDDCDPNSNGEPGLQTSTGPEDVLPWGEDDCIAWHTAFPEMSAQRPVQWTPGEYPCNENQKVWTTTTRNTEPGTGLCDQGFVYVHRLDGDTGTVEDTIEIPEVPCTNGGMSANGPYGGAVDHEGNFWFHNQSTSHLVRVDNETLEYEVHNLMSGAYGITVDTHGRVWMSSVLSRFDPQTGEWKHQPVSTSGGLGQDLQDRMWFPIDNGVQWAELESLALGPEVRFPGAQVGTIKGVSVDFDGYVWATRSEDGRAFKIDPNTYEIESVSGLNTPYTYSDMTGGALVNVTCYPPEG